MRKTLRFYLFIFFACSFSSIKAQLSHEIAIGGKFFDFASGIVQTSDGDFILSGTTGNYDPFYHPGQGMYLIKIDSAGKVKWAKNCLGFCSHAVKLVNVADQQYIITIGDYNGSSEPNSEILCYDTAGHLLWSRYLAWNTYTSPSLFALAQGKHNDIMIIGGYDTWATLSDPPTFSSPYLDFDDTTLENGIAINLYRYNISTGNMLESDILIDTGFHCSTNFVSGNTLLYANGIAPTKDGGYVITGGIGAWLTGTTSGLLAKVDSLGIFQWAKKFKGTDSIGISIISTNDGGYVVTGITSNKHIYVEKLDSAFSVTWEHTISGISEDRPECIIQTTDGGYAITGYSNSRGKGDKDVYLVKLDTGGNLQWNKYIGGTGLDDGGISLIQTSWPKTTGYAIAGFTHSFGVAPTDSGNIYFIKTDSVGNSCNAVTESAVQGVGNNIVSNVTLKDTLNYTDDTLAYITTGDSVIVICSSVAGLNDITSISVDNAKVYPNPFSTTSTLLLNEAGTHYMELCDIMGRKLRVLKCSTHQFELNREGLSAGVYILKIYDSQMRFESSLKIMAL